MLIKEGENGKSEMWDAPDIVPTITYSKQPARIPLENYSNIRRRFGAIQALPSWQKAQPVI